MAFARISDTIEATGKLFCTEAFVEEKESRRIGILQREWRTIQGGRLYIRERDDRITFTEFIDGRHYGITKKMNRVYELARRDYLQSRIRYLQSRNNTEDKSSVYRRKLAKAENELRKCIQKFQNAGLDLNRIILSQAQQEWKQQEQEGRFTDGALWVSEECFDYEGGYYTNRGIRVGSESEQTIANLMDRMGVAYRYEPMLNIDGRAYFPKFVIMLEDGNLVIIEHFKRMDRASYVREIIERMEAYSNAGIEVGKNLFLVFEKDTMELERLRRLIMLAMEADASGNKVLSGYATGGTEKYLRN